MNGYDFLKAAACRPGLTVTQRAVLVALAVHANSDGVCWPEVARLVEMTAMSRASVYRALDALGNHGLVTRDGKRFILSVKLVKSHIETPIQARIAGAVSHSETKCSDSGEDEVSSGESVSQGDKGVSHRDKVSHSETPYKEHTKEHTSEHTSGQVPACEEAAPPPPSLSETPPAPAASEPAAPWQKPTMADMLTQIISTASQPDPEPSPAPLSKPVLASEHFRCHSCQATETKDGGSWVRFEGLLFCSGMCEMGFKGMPALDPLSKYERDFYGEFTADALVDMFHDARLSWRKHGGGRADGQAKEWLKFLKVLKKHKLTQADIIPRIARWVAKDNEYRIEMRKLFESGQIHRKDHFVPQRKNFSTFINEQCWDDFIPPLPNMPKTQTMVWNPK